MTVVQRAPGTKLGSAGLARSRGGSLPVEPIRRHLAHFDDAEHSRNTLRAYHHQHKLFWDYRACAQRGDAT